MEQNPTQLATQITRKVKQLKLAKRKKNTTKRNNRIGTIRKMLTNPNTIEDVTSFNEPTQFRRFKDPDTLIPALDRYHQYVRSQYLLGLVHPDQAVEKGIAIKLPSDIPLPTASIGYHCQYILSTSTAGTFLLTWRPNFLMTEESLSAYALNASAQLTFNNAATLVGNAPNTSNYFQPTGVYPSVSLQRYRMVSSLLKVSYNGSVLNQSGSMLACATFDPFKVATGSAGTAVTTLADSLVDRFGNFSLIQNGLWNKTTNLTKDSEGLECLYVPTDPDDYMFQKLGYFYGSGISSATSWPPDSEGAHINYVVAGRNLPAATQCIVVDAYYNYEVIADPSAAYILRSTPDMAYNAGDKSAIMNTFSDVIKKGGLIKAASANNFSWSNAFGSVLKQGLKYLPMVLSAL